MKAVNFGIDLGTTNSLIAKFENGKVVLFKNPAGHKESMASVVAFRKDRALTGDKAREYLLKDPVNVFGGFKRRMGTDDRFYVVNIDENITPVELSAYVLKELKRFVHSGETVEAAVITIPASFDTMQANATKKAGKLAGFDEVFLLQEPVAASLAYFNAGGEGEKSGCRLVYDLGGGTFDVALVEVVDGEMKVKDHEGNNFLGGVDFDMLILERIIVPRIVAETQIDDFYEQLTVKYGKYEKLYYQLMYQAEEAKKEVCGSDFAEIEFSAEINGRNYDFCIAVTKEEFQELIAGKVQETVKMLNAILERNNLQTTDIEEIILVGGSTLIPYVRNRLSESTGIRVNASIDPITAVAVGAAYYAANKYYEPQTVEVVRNKNIDEAIDSIASSYENEELPDFDIDLSYNKMSRENEEVLLVKVRGNFDRHTCRITRNDGGFDSGTVALKAKLTEFLPLLPNVINMFRLRIFDARDNEISALSQEISIVHGQYNISGQPLPKDICIEVDDKENRTTRLEVIFEKNSILPLKKTLFREISKTIRKGSNDSIIINILEGDRFARAVSNLPIACIEISGKQLTSDLINGSDIEIKISISDNRELSVETSLVMTHQEFKNEFSVSEKHINILRLKEQVADLENEIRDTLKQYNIYDTESWIPQIEELLDELEIHIKSLAAMKENDTTDKRYVIAEAVSRISQEFDKIGGNERLESLRDEYFKNRELVEQALPSVDIDKDAMNLRFRKITENENYILRSKNPSILKRSCKSLDDLYWDILWCTNSHIAGRYCYIKMMDENQFNSYNTAQLIFGKADKALADGRYIELKRLIGDLLRVMKIDRSYSDKKPDKFTGLGIS